jgi:hypothetical protein
VLHRSPLWRLSPVDALELIRCDDGWVTTPRIDFELLQESAQHRPPLRRGSQAEAYLSQACDALRSAGDAAFLWRIEPAQRFGSGSVLATLQLAMDASNRRLRSLRSVPIFAALALEAFANDFLAELLSPADAIAVDRLTTLDKLLLGPRIAGASSTLTRDAEPLQTIKKLLHVRNRLVHARASGYSPFTHSLTDRDESDFGPIACGRYLLRSAEVIALLDALCQPPHTVGLSIYLSQAPQVIDEYISSIGKNINQLVLQGEPSPADLQELAERQAMDRGKRAAAKRQVPPTEGTT